MTEDQYCDEYRALAARALREQWDEVKMWDRVREHRFVEFPLCLEVIRHSSNNNEWFNRMGALARKELIAEGTVALCEGIARYAFYTDIEVKLEHLEEDAHNEGGEDSEE